MIDLKGKKVTVMGLGLHGGALGNIEWLVNQGAEVTATDLKTEEQLKKTVEKMKERGLLNPHPNPLPGKGEGSTSSVRLVLGEHREEDFRNADLILRNPGVPRDSKFIQIAKENDVSIEMDSSLFFQNCLADIIGVTGSKGKTTTSNAITVLLKKKYSDLVAVGIDGASPLRSLPRATEGHGPVVFELSSWRLEPLDERKLGPKVAMVTSIFRDHLNTYDSFEDYIEVKKSILKHQSKDSVAILNKDDERIREWGDLVKGKLYWYSLKDLSEGDGVFVKEGRINMRDNGEELDVMDLDELPLDGEHERRNLLPGILIAYLYGVSKGEIVDGLRSIKRLPHRMELVRELDGVTYINDSAATMPDATVAALRTLKGSEIIHVLGGSDKELVFGELAETEQAMGSDLKALVWLPGNATDKMKEELKNAGVEVAARDADSMQEAVVMARELAQAGDVVLMSPAATSFGLFQHEFDRGDQYREAVNNLR